MSGGTPSENPYQAAAAAAHGGKAAPVAKRPAASPKAPPQRPPDPAAWVGAVHELHREERETLPKAKANNPASEDLVNSLGHMRVRLHFAVSDTGATGSTGSPELAGYRLSETMEAREEYHRNVGAAFPTGFEPQRHSTYIMGRPVQVLALTHEKATAEERMPYLSWLFHPVPVHNLVGRTADMEPECSKCFCVWYAWKEPLHNLKPHSCTCLPSSCFF